MHSLVGSVSCVTLLWGLPTPSTNLSVESSGDIYIYILQLVFANHVHCHFKVAILEVKCECKSQSKDYLSFQVIIWAHQLC